MADNSTYSEALGSILEDENVHGLVLCVVPHVETIQKEKFADDLVPILKRYDLPVVVSCVGGEKYDLIAKAFEKERIPVFQTPERAVKALNAFISYNLELGDKSEF